MKRVVCHIFLLFLLLVTGSTVLWAEEQLPQKLQKLTDEAYRCYSARETENFFESIKRVKDATEFSDYQETYYRACSYAHKDVHQDEVSKSSGTFLQIPFVTVEADGTASKAFLLED